MNIIKAQLTDLPRIVEIYNQSIVTKKATADLLPVTIEEKRAWFNEHYTHPFRPIYVLKNAQGMVIAWGCYSDFFNREAYHITAEISIYIDNTQQGKGLGKQFVNWMLIQAEELNIHNILAKVFAHNLASLALFTSFEFEQWGYLPQVCDMKGFIADIVILGKKIESVEKRTNNQ